MWCKSAPDPENISYALFSPFREVLAIVPDVYVVDARGSKGLPTFENVADRYSNSD